MRVGGDVGGTKVAVGGRGVALGSGVATGDGVTRTGVDVAAGNALGVTVGMGFVATGAGLVGTVPPSAAVPDGTAALLFALGTGLAPAGVTPVAVALGSPVAPNAELVNCPAFPPAAGVLLVVERMRELGDCAGPARVAVTRPLSA